MEQERLKNAASRDAELRVAWELLPNEVSALFLRLPARAGDAIVRSIHTFTQATESGIERPVGFARCHALIEAAGQRDELDYIETCTLLDYVTRLDLELRVAERHARKGDHHI